MKIRVGYVDDQTIVRQGIVELLRLRPDFDVVLEAGDGEAAMELLETTECDVLLVDLRMPRLDGVGLLGRLGELQRPPRVLILTTFDDGDAILRAIRSGARGVMLKDVSLDELADAIQTVWGGGTVYRPTLFSPNPQKLAYEKPSWLEPLTEREEEICSLMAAGFGNREIAAALNLAEGTVKNYVSTILIKLDARDRTHAVLKRLGQLQAPR